MSKVWNTVECNWFWRVIAGVIFGMTLGYIVSAAIDAATVNNAPPVVFSKVEALNSPVPLGGSLDVRITRDKRRSDCTVKSERYATNHDGEVQELPDRVWQGGAANTEFLEYSYDVSALPVGRYTLHVQLTYFCDGGRQVFPIEQPSINFRITDLG
jgi:hypothetical protein